MFAASKSGSAAPKDSQFNYVTMLLHGNGTNGAQNNTFLDSSTNNFTITRNGNTTQGSFSPYGSNWSNYFNGSTDWLTTVSNVTAFGSGNWTVEFWVYPTVSGATQVIYDTRTTSQGLYPNFYINTSNKINFYINTGDALTSTNALTLNAWNHIAFVKNSTTTTCYINGVANGTYSDTNTYVTSTPTFCASGINVDNHNYKFTGYLSNLRVVVGTAVYTSAFTPPTAPLTAISGTALLTCQSNRFVDNSTNNNTLTPSGTPSVQRFNPFGTSTAYSTSVIGGSGYFDNSGDYLSAPASANLALGTGNFTLEAWVYATGAFATDPIFESRSAGGSTAGYAFLVNSSGKLDIYNNGFVGQSSIGLNINCWNHVAVVRSGTGTNQTAYYVNGAAAGTVTFAANLTDGSSNETKIGGSTSAGENWGGYICDGRITKSVVYSGAFTPNTSPLTAITNTQLLCNMTNGAIYDNAMMNDLETVGNVQISTSVKKYGTGSMYFDGTGDYLYQPIISPNFSFPESFTIEFWVNFSSVPANYIALFGGTGANTQFFITTKSNGNGLRFGLTGVAEYAAGTKTWSTGTWYHIALVRNGTNVKFYVDGTNISDSTYTNSTTYTGALLIGGGLGVSDLNGYLDDVRITKGYARYTANFTAPTKEFPNN